MLDLFSCKITFKIPTLTSKAMNIRMSVIVSVDFVRSRK